MYILWMYSIIYTTQVTSALVMINGLTRAYLSDEQHHEKAVFKWQIMMNNSYCVWALLHHKAAERRGQQN